MVFLVLVLPPVLVPRQSEYARPPPPLPAPFRAAEDPPMPYNASFPFVNRPRPNTAEQSPPNSFEISGNVFIIQPAKRTTEFSSRPCGD